MWFKNLILYTVVVSIALPLGYGSYLDEVDKRKSIKLNLNVFKSAGKTISQHLKSTKNLQKKKVSTGIKLEKEKELKIKIIPKKIIIPKTLFKRKLVAKIKVKTLSIKKEQIVKISNDSLVDHYGFKVEESKIDLMAHFKRHKIKETLATLEYEEKKRKKERITKSTPLIALAKERQKNQFQVPLKQKKEEEKLTNEKNNLKIDRVKHKMASDISLPLAKNISSKENEYPKTGPPLNTHSSIASANKDILSPVVRQAIDRAYTRFDLNIQNKNNDDLFMNTQKDNQNNGATAQIQQKNSNSKGDLAEGDLAIFTYPNEQEEKNLAATSSSLLDIDQMLASHPNAPLMISKKNKILKGNSNKFAMDNSSVVDNPSKKNS